MQEFAFFAGIIIAVLVLALVAGWCFFLLGHGKMPLTHIALVLTNLGKAVLQLILIPFDIVRIVLQRLAVRRVWALAMLALWYFTAIESASMLKFFDELYSRWYDTFWSGFMADFFYVLNLVWSTLVPIANSITVLTQNLAYMALDNVYRCQDNAYETAVGVIGMVPVFVGEIGKSFGKFKGNDTQGNNPLVNVFNTTSAYQSLQNGTAGFVVLANCSCGDYSDVWDTMYNEVINPTYAEALSNVTYAPVCFLQKSLLLEPYAPCFDALSAGVYGYGHALDSLVKIALALADAEASLPQPFVFGSIARLYQSGIATFGVVIDVMVRAVMRDHNDDALYMRESFSQLYAAADGFSASAAWLGSLIDVAAHGSTVLPPASGAPQCNIASYNDIAQSAAPDDSAQCHCAALTSRHAFAGGECAASGVMHCFEGYVQLHPRLLSSACIPKRTCCYELNGVCRVQADAHGRCQCGAIGILNVTSNSCVKSASGCSNDNPSQLCGFAANTRTPPACLATAADPDSTYSNSPLSCALGSFARAKTMIVHTVWRFVFLLLFRTDEAQGQTIYSAWQAVDGLWENRHSTKYTSCEYRKNATAVSASSSLQYPNMKYSSQIDTSLLQENFACNATAATKFALLCTPASCVYDPVGAAPTLQLVYSEYDKFAFHLGQGLALPLTVGGIVTSVLRTMVETARVVTRGLGLFAPFIFSAFEGPPITSQINGGGTPIRDARLWWGATFTGPSPSILKVNMSLALQLQKLSNTPMHDVSDETKLRAYIRSATLVLLKQQFVRNVWGARQQLTYSNPQNAKAAYDAVNGGNQCMFQVVYKQNGLYKYGYFPSTVDTSYASYSHVVEPDMSKVFLPATTQKFCNSMLFEWLFYRTSETSLALANMLDLFEGPLGNPGSLDSAVLTNACHDSANKFVIMERSAVSVLFDCKPGDMTCSEKDKMFANLKNFDEPQWCPIYGVLRLPCSLGALVRQTTRLTVHMARQVCTNAFGVLGAANAYHVLDVATYGQRCELDQTLGLACSSLSTLFAGSFKASDVVQEALTTTLFALAEFFQAPLSFVSWAPTTFASQIVQLTSMADETTLLTLELQSIVQLAYREVTGDINVDSAQNYVAVMIAADIKRQIIRSWQLATAMEQVLVDVSDTCKGCATAAKIMHTVQNAMAGVIAFVSEALADVLTVAFVAVTDIVNVLSGAPNADSNLVADLRSLANYTFHHFTEAGFFGLADVLLFKSLGSESKGPGAALKSMITTGCQKIATFIRGQLTQDEEKIAIEDTEAVEEPITGEIAEGEIVEEQTSFGTMLAKLKSFAGSFVCLAGTTALSYELLTHTGAGSGLPFRRLGATQTVNDSSLVNLFDWHGDSLCTVHYTLYKPGMPLSADMLWCMQNRMRADVLRTYIPALPSTFFDDWTQPVRFFAEAGTAWFVLRTEGPDAVQNQNHSLQLAYWLDRALPVHALQAFGRRARAEHTKLLRKYPIHRLPRHRRRLAQGPLRKPITSVKIQPRRRLTVLHGIPTPAPTRVNCAEPYCFKCLMLTQTIGTIAELAELNKNFYVNQYAAHIRPDFLQYWRMDAIERKKFVQSNAGEKWQYNYKTADMDSLEAWFGQWGDASARTLEDAGRMFFTANATTPVPLLGRSLWYYVESALRPCDPQALFRTQPQHGTYYALCAALSGVAVFYALHLLLPWLPLPIFAGSLVAAYAYLNTAYDWSVRCWPALPANLITDIMNFVYGKSLPPCMCSFTPSLVSATGCTHNCIPGVASATYATCPDRPVWFNLAFFVRWVWPSGFLQMRHILHGRILANLIREAATGQSVTGSEIACFFATLPSFLVMLGGVVILLSAIPAILARILEAFWYVFEATLWLTLALVQTLTQTLGNDVGGVLRTLNTKPQLTILSSKKRA